MVNQARLEALDKAVRISLSKSVGSDSDEAIVARAEAFYDFLTGSASEEGQTR